MAGYTRQSLSEIQDGQVVDAVPINAEYNTIQGAFSAVSGHKHDGTSAEGAPITVVGPTQNVNISATEMYPRVNNYVNIGTDALKFKDLKLAGNVTVSGKVLASNGTAAAPSIAFAGDTNTGIASLGADVMALVAGGAAKLTVDTVYGLTANQGLYFPTGAKIEAFDGTINSTVSAGGSANAITVTVPVKNATQFYLRPITANTGATTISINGGAAIPVLTPDGGALPAGYTLPTGGPYPPLLIVHMGSHVRAFRTYVERGSNANGDYIRFADGTQICTYSSGSGVGPITTSVGSIWKSAEYSWTFPASFATTVNLSVSGSLRSNATAWSKVRLTSVSSVEVVLFAATSLNNLYSVDCSATGRWF